VPGDLGHSGLGDPAVEAAIEIAGLDRRAMTAGEDQPGLDPRTAGAAQYAQFCGATLARAHARWGDRIAIASYLGQGDMFDRAIAEFSAVYADQNERDYQAFTEAVNSGRLIAQTSV
jgi:hypothetical protein